jgi:hypothetical protein
VGGGDVFLIDGDGDGGPRDGVGRDEGAATGEEIADRGSLGEFEGTGGGAEVIAERAEGEEGDAHWFLLSVNCAMGLDVWGG